MRASTPGILTIERWKRGQNASRKPSPKITRDRLTIFHGFPIVPLDCVIVTPTMKRKNGKMVSVGVQPFHFACSRGQYTLSQSPGLLTIIMAAIVAPRKTSSDTRRVAAAAADADARLAGAAVT